MSKAYNGIEMGDEVRDTITGFTGIVTARIEYITGCAQVAIQPAVKADGALPDGKYFDIDRIEIVTAKAHQHVVTRAGAGDPPARV